MIQTTQLFGLPFVNATPSTWYTHIKTILHNNEKAFLVTANPELVLRSLRHPLTIISYNKRHTLHPTESA